jgi:hypothetical protein
VLALKRDWQNLHISFPYEMAAISARWGNKGHPTGIVRDASKNAFTVEPWLAEALVNKKSMNNKEFWLHLPCSAKKNFTSTKN